MHAAGVGRGAHPVGELLRERLGAKLLERPIVARREAPPPCLSFLPELLHEHRRPPRRADPQNRPARLRGLRRALDVYAAALRQVEQQTRSPIELDQDELAPASDPLDLPALELLRPRLVRLQRRELEHVERRELRAGKDLVEPLYERLDLGVLRHVRPPRRPCG